MSTHHPSRKSRRASRFFSKSFILGRRQQRSAHRRVTESTLLQEEGLLASSARDSSLTSPLRRTLSHDVSRSSSTRVSQASNRRGYPSSMGAASSTSPANSMMNLQAEVVQTLQWTLWYILSCIGAYLLGVHQPLAWLNHEVLYHVGLMVLAAWLTCSTIRIVTWWIRIKKEHEEQEAVRLVAEEEEQALLQSLQQDEESYPFEDTYGSTKTVMRGGRRPPGRKVDLGVISSNLSLEEDAILGKDDSLSLSLSEEDVEVENEVERFNEGSLEEEDILYDLSGTLEMNKKMEAKSKKFFKNRGRKRTFSSAAGSKAEPSPARSLPPSFRTLPPKSTVIENHLSMNRTHPRPQNHPELENLYVINIDTAERVYPNGAPLPFDNDLVQGHIMLMIRTSDADTPTPSPNPPGTAGNQAASKYFRPKQRRFEVQFQVRFKKVPPSQLFFCCELNQSLKMGMVQRAFVNAALNFVKKKNPGFSYDLNGDDGVKDNDLGSGKYCNPHMTFPLETGMDRIQITKMGDTPPLLGSEIVEGVEEIKRRKKEGVAYNTDDIYTVAVWSAYVDFAKWKCLNLPAIRPFSLASAIGDKTFNISFYHLKEPNGKHYVSNLNRFSFYEFGHKKKTSTGPATTRWLQSLGQNLVVDDASLKVSVCEGDREVNGNPELSDGDSENVEEDVDQYDQETIEELGEGIYLKSGDNVVLRESYPGDNPSFLTNGGGFATLQNMTTSTVIIEKVEYQKHTRKGRYVSTVSNRSQSKLIRSSDVVMIKLVECNQHGETEMKYLSIHRGWWLKWVTHVPKTSGFFSIITNESEGQLEISSNVSPLTVSIETQSSFVRLGGSFSLRNIRKRGIRVGVRVESSPTLGGRIIGLFKEGSSSVMDADTEQNDADDEYGNKDLLSPKERKQMMHMMKPLHLCAFIPTTIEKESPALPLEQNQSVNTNRLKGNFRVDAPAWIEMMHRSKRKKQRVYAVRMITSRTSDLFGQEILKNRSQGSNSISSSIVSDEEDNLDDGLKFRIHLRTGLDLAPCLRLRFQPSGIHNMRSTGYDVGIHSMGSSGYNVSENVMTCASNDNIGKVFESSGSMNSDAKERIDGYDISSPMFTTTNANIDRVDDDGPKSSISGVEEDFYDEGSISDVSIDEITERRKNFNEHLDDNLSYAKLSESPRRPLGQKRKKWIGKVAKGTGKNVIKSGKIVGKVVSKSVIGHGKKVPKREPKLRRRRTEKRAIKKNADHHVAVNRALSTKNKKRRRNLDKLVHVPNKLMAGQLSAPDQSCRIISHVLAELSATASEHSAISYTMTDAICSLLAHSSEFDSWFLRGGCLELGVVPLKVETIESPATECIVARCLWDSHWREEACMVYNSSVSFYAPLSKKPSFVLYKIDIQKIRIIDDNSQTNPLSGFPMIAIETALRCHYLAFVDDEVRMGFYNRLTLKGTTLQGDSLSKELLRGVNIWQGIQESSNASVYGSRGKWAPVISSKRPHQRIVLNSRKMTFDVEKEDLGSSLGVEESIGSFVEDLLRTALSFSLKSFSDPNKFVAFLDKCSQLQTLPLQCIDFSKKEALCIFVNLYHCLLQHALLLSDCPPTKKTIVNFLRTHCYEIGGDVFSLAELESCVIRGNLSRPQHPKPPYAQAPKKSSAHRAYALAKPDPRINFILNTAIKSKPAVVPILTPEKLEGQLTFASQSFLREHLTLDTDKRTVTLPKICEVYRNDFGGGDPNVCAHYCLQFLGEAAQSSLIDLMNDDGRGIIVRYGPSCDKFHAFLVSQD